MMLPAAFRSLARVLRTLRAAVTERRLDRDMDDEWRFHLEARTDDLVKTGLDREAAERRAREEFGAMLRWKEQGREARGLRFLGQLTTDARYGLRWLRRSPALATAAILSIAIGVGANTAIFSLANTVMMKLLPVRDPASIVILSRSDDTRGTGSSYSYPFYRELRNLDSLSGTIAGGSFGPNAEANDGAPERLSGQLVSGNYFDVLGITPHLGRLLTPDDDRVPGGHPVVVLDYGYWQRRFGGDPRIVGRTLVVNNHALTIVGVTPAEFKGLELGTACDIRVPMAMQLEMMGSPRLEDPRELWLGITGRLKPGVSRETARQELDARFQAYLSRLNVDGAAAPAARPPRVVLIDGSRGHQTLARRFAQPLAVLGGLSIAVLILVCLNVANLMLARTAARTRELSLRLALGASRGRIVSQLLVETLLVAATGGVLGVLVAKWAAQAFASLALPSPTGPALEVTMDMRVLMFGLALSIVTGLVCGLSPALSARRADLAAALRVEGRGFTGSRLTGRKLLVAAQIALSFVLLAGAGLFARTLVNLRDLDVGFDDEHLLMVRLDPTLSKYDSPRVFAFYDQLTERLDALPGVRGSTVALVPPLAGSNWGSGLTLDTGKRDDAPGPDRNVVRPGYFAAIGMPIVAGRDFTKADVDAGQNVAVVNEAVVRRYFGGPSPLALGRRIGVGGATGKADHVIVGVARDAKLADVRESIEPFWWAPYQQLGRVADTDVVLRARQGLYWLIVRTSGNPDTVAAAVREAIASIDRRVTLWRMSTVPQQVAERLIFERVLAGLAAAFAIVAMLLAALGLYGVTAYDTAARTREIGVRMAIGATPPEILSLILRQTAMLVAAGLATGALLAAAGIGYVRSLLFGLEPTDPLVMASAAIVVIAVTMLAAWIPARRATRIDPIKALQ
jgi:predicted permease